jgi:hypothetical protein
MYVRTTFTQNKQQTLVYTRVVAYLFIQLLKTTDILCRLISQENTTV